jgi:DNA-binding SARP family transcriptional activator
MGRSIRLLGRPRIEDDGAPVTPPRGRKTWALLTFLLLSERAPSRARTAALLFPEADDPLGALRWTVADVRRALGGADTVRGDPLTLHLPAGTTVDVTAVLQPSGAPAATVPDGELLEGLGFPSSPVLEAWLGVVRGFVAGAVRALVHDEAVARLAAGDVGTASDLARRLVTREPLDQQAHELYVRCLARAGHQVEAERHVAECEALLRRELGVRAGPELRLAAAEPAAVTTAAGDVEAALAQLAAGQAAVGAGAVEPGLAILRQACAEAAAAGDAAVEARALTALGAALVHAVRGRDEEGALRLQEALRLASVTGDRAVAATACRELGYIDTQAGRLASAGRWLTRATELADGDEQLCAVLGVRGMALSDGGSYAAALELLTESAERARRAGRPRQAAWSLSLIGRAHVLCGNLAAAVPALDASLALVADERWTAFRPWPEALRAEAALLSGHPDDAAAALDRTFRLACRLGDPCWEAMSVRLAGLVARSGGHMSTARDRFTDALSRVTRVSDTYVWVHGHVLDSAADLAAATGMSDAADLAARLATLAERCGFRELVVRAHLHRARLGEPAAAETAALLAAGVDNPALTALIAA